MKINTLLLLISIILSSCLNQKGYHIDEVTSPNDSLLYLKIDMSLVNGIVYCEHGQNGEYVNGKKDGPHKTWDYQGFIEEEGNYKDGKKEGLHLRYSGHKTQRYKREEGNYKDGKKVGLHKKWIGEVITDEGNYKNGRKHGLHRDWWVNNGQLSREGYYKDGKKVGLHKMWDENGQVLEELNLNGELLNGVCTWYHDNGEVKKTGTYSNSRKKVLIPDSYIDVFGKWVVLPSYTSCFPIPLDRKCFNKYGHQIQCQ